MLYAGFEHHSESSFAFIRLSNYLSEKQNIFFLIEKKKKGRSAKLPARGENKTEMFESTREHRRILSATSSCSAYGWARAKKPLALRRYARLAFLLNFFSPTVSTPTCRVAFFTVLRQKRTGARSILSSNFMWKIEKYICTVNTRRNPIWRGTAGAVSQRTERTSNTKRRRGRNNNVLYFYVFTRGRYDFFNLFFFFHFLYDDRIQGLRAERY